MSKELKLKPIASALGITLIATLATAPIAQADQNPFGMSEVSGYMVAGLIGEGKDKEGKCGDKKDKEGKCGEGKCGEGKDKDKEGKCGEGKDKEGKCGEGKDKESEGTCGGAA